MNIIAVYPGAKEISIATSTNGQTIGTASVPYPECNCEIGSTVETVKGTLGIDVADIGITCYGMLPQTSSHVVDLTPELVDGACSQKYGYDRTNFGIIYLASLGAKKMSCAYPLTYDILPDTMKLSGIPQIERRQVGHLLDHILARRHCEKEVGDKANAVTCYLSGDEITVAAWKGGKLANMNSSFDGEGPMTPTRSGFFHQRCVYKMALSGKFEKDSLLSKVRFIGGLASHLGTSDIGEIRLRIASGDGKARLVYEAMVYQIAKTVGRMATQSGKPQAVIFTGHLSSDEKLIADISDYTSYIGITMILPPFDGAKLLLETATGHG